MNIPELQKCWANYPQAEIHQVGICTSAHNASTIKFYYAEQDGPHFHVASMKREHVEQYYRFPGDIIKEIDIVCVSLQGFINQVIGNQRIDLLCIDIEGMEAEIIPEIDWKNLNCHRLSFEFCHLGDKQEKVLRTLGNAGYIFIGTGIDYQGGDWLFENIGLK
jgi:hypothetical protein